MKISQKISKFKFYKNKQKKVKQIYKFQIRK